MTDSYSAPRAAALDFLTESYPRVAPELLRKLAARAATIWLDESEIPHSRRVLIYQLMSEVAPSFLLETVSTELIQVMESAASQKSTEAAPSKRLKVTFLSGNVQEIEAAEITLGDVAGTYHFEGSETHTFLALNLSTVQYVEGLL